MFVTTPEFLPQHHAQRQATLQIITAAEAAGHARVAEMNRQVAANLDKIITALEDDADSHQAAAEMPPEAPAPLAAAAARRHQLTRARAIRAVPRLDRARRIPPVSPGHHRDRQATVSWRTGRWLYVRGIWPGARWRPRG